MPPRVPLSEQVAELTASCALAHEQQGNIQEQVKRLQRREHKARARNRASWRDMSTFAVMVLAIVWADFSWVHSLLSRFQQTSEPEDVQDEITNNVLELLAEELQRMLELEGRTSVNQASLPSRIGTLRSAGWRAWIPQTSGRRKRIYPP